MSHRYEACRGVPGSLSLPLVVTWSPQLQAPGCMFRRCPEAGPFAPCSVRWSSGSQPTRGCMVDSACIAHYFLPCSNIIMSSDKPTSHKVICSDKYVSSRSMPGPETIKSLIDLRCSSAYSSFSRTRLCCWHIFPRGQHPGRLVPNTLGPGDSDRPARWTEGPPLIRCKFSGLDSSA